MPPEIPDLPDDYTTDDPDHGDRVVAIIAGAVLLAVLIIAAILIGVFA